MATTASFFARGIPAGSSSATGKSIPAGHPNRFPPAATSIWPLDKY